MQLKQLFEKYKEKRKQIWKKNYKQKFINEKALGPELEQKFKDLMHIRRIQMHIERQQFLANLEVITFQSISNHLETKNVSSTNTVRRQSFILLNSNDQNQASVQPSFQNLINNDMQLLRQNLIMPKQFENHNYNVQSKNFAGYIEPKKVTFQNRIDRINQLKQLFYQKLHERLKQQQNIRVHYNLQTLKLFSQFDESRLISDLTQNINNQKFENKEIIDQKQKKIRLRKNTNDQVFNLTQNKQENQNNNENQIFNDEMDESDLQSQKSESSVSESDKQSNTSLYSDESYYDENDDLFAYQDNFNQLKAQKDDLFKIKRNQNFSIDFQVNQQTQIDQAQSLKQIFEISDKLNVSNIQDKDLMHTFQFVQEIPVFKGKLQNISKSTTRYLLENMKIKIFHRGQVLFKQNDPCDVAYFVLLGVINFYDENLIDYDNLNQKKRNISADSFQQNEAQIIIQQSDKIVNRSQQLKKLEIDQQKVNQKKLMINSNESSLQQLNLIESPSNQSNKSQGINEKDLDIFNKQVDSSINLLKSIQYKKVGCSQAGSIVGSIFSKIESKQFHEFTGICKTDCILLELKQNIFQTLEKQKIKKEKDFIINHLILTFPTIQNFYSIIKITENLKYFKNKKTFSKNEIIQREGSENKNLYLITSGRGMIVKRVEYMNEKDNKMYHQYLEIMEIEAGDIIGEEPIWYNSSVCLYSVRVSSISLTAICIHHQDLLQTLGKVVPSHLPVIEQRNSFIQQRIQSILKSNQFQNIKNASNYNQNQLLLQQSRSFSNNSEQTYEKLKQIYIRNLNRSNSPSKFQQNKNFDLNKSMSSENGVKFNNSLNRKINDSFNSLSPKQTQNLSKINLLSIQQTVEKTLFKSRKSIQVTEKRKSKLKQAFLFQKGSIIKIKEKQNDPILDQNKIHETNGMIKLNDRNSQSQKIQQFFNTINFDKTQSFKKQIMLPKIQSIRNVSFQQNSLQKEKSQKILLRNQTENKKIKLDLQTNVQKNETVQNDRYSQNLNTESTPIIKNSMINQKLFKKLSDPQVLISIQQNQFDLNPSSLQTLNKSSFANQILNLDNSININDETLRQNTSQERKLQQQQLIEMSTSSNKSNKIQPKSTHSSIGRMSSKQLQFTQYENIMIKDKSLNSSQKNANSPSNKLNQVHFKDEDSIHVNKINELDNLRVIQKLGNKMQNNSKINIEFPMKVYINRHDSPQHNPKIVLNKKNSLSKSDIDIRNPKNQMKSIFQNWQNSIRRLNEKIKDKQIISFSKLRSTNQTTQRQNSSFDNQEVSFQKQLQQKGINHIRIKKKFENVLQMQAQRQNNLSFNQNKNSYILLNSQNKSKEQNHLPQIKQMKSQNSVQQKLNFNNDIKWKQIQQNNILTETLNSNQQNSQNQSNVEISQRKIPILNVNFNQANILLEENNPESKFKQEFEGNKNEKSQQYTSFEQKQQENFEQNQSEKTFQQLSQHQKTFDQQTKSQITQMTQMNFNSIVNISHQDTEQLLQNHHYFQKDNLIQKSYFNTNQAINKKEKIYHYQSSKKASQNEDLNYSNFDKYLPNKLFKPIQKHLTGYQPQFKNTQPEMPQNDIKIDDSILDSHLEFQKSYQNFVNRKFESNNYILQQKNLRQFIKSQLDQKYNFQSDEVNNVYRTTFDSTDQLTKLHDSIKILYKLKADMTSPKQMKDHRKYYISSDSLKKIKKMIHIESDQKNQQNPYDQVIKGQSVQIERFIIKKEIPKLSKIKFQQKQFFLKLQKTQQSETDYLANLNQLQQSGNQSSLMSNRIINFQKS